MNPFHPSKRRSLRGRLATVAVAGSAALVAVATMGVGVAGADGPSQVTTPSQGAPHFNTTQASQVIRGSGSDTTFFMMQKISDIFTGAGLYGCTLAGLGGPLAFTSGTAANAEYDCEPGGQAPSGDDVSTTDDADNWDRTEVLEGTNDVGSGAGQDQLCGVVTSPDTVNFARSSKPEKGGQECSGNEQELGYAKDGVPIVDFPTINPSSIGTSTFSNVASNAYPAAPYASINGGNVGPVSAGWLPGDNPQGSSFNGSKLLNISNIGAANTSVAHRLWCTIHTGNGIGVDPSGAITDWGQLTNLGPNLEVNVDTTSGSSTVTIDPSSGTAFGSTITSGNGVTDPFATLGATPFASGTTVSTNGGSTLTLSGPATATGTYTLTFATGASKLAQGSGVPIGIPIRVLGVSNTSGTEYTFSQFVQGATAPTDSTCPDGTGGIGMNENAANDPNGATAVSPNPYHSALENNAHQLELFSQADFPSDQVDQAIEEATTLYFMSAGVYNSNPYVASTTIGSTNYGANLIAENGIFSGSTTELNNTYPTARTLSNIINAQTVTQSTAGFMNWVCDSNANFLKGTDLNTGLNYSSEISNLISTTYQFPQLTDLTGAVSTTPADRTTAPNNDCSAQITVTADGTDGNVTYVSAAQGAPASTTFPASVEPYSYYASALQAHGAGTVVGTGVPAGTQVLSAGGGTSITLSSVLPAGNYTLDFLGVPAVTEASTTP